MRINPVAYFNFNIKNCKQKNNFCCNKTNIVTYDTVSFSGKSKEKSAEDKLVRVANKYSIPGRDNRDTIRKLVAAASNGEPIGEGSESRIYKIPETNYVAKVYKADVYKPTSTKITTRDKLNGILYKDNDFSILEYIDGAHLSKANSKENSNEFGYIATAMPQKSYNDFLDTMCKVHKKGLYFDYWGKNLIVDYNNSRFVAFDYNSIVDDGIFIMYEADFDPLNGNNTYFNPIECITSTIDVKKTHKCYQNHLIKIMKSILNDYKNYNMFKLNNPNMFIAGCNDENELEELMAKIAKLTEEKKKLSKENFSNQEIKEKLEEETAFVNKRLDALYDKSSDAPFETLPFLNEIIELKYQARKKEKELTAPIKHPQKTTSSVFIDMILAKEKIGYYNNKIRSIQTELVENYPNCFKF